MSLSATLLRLARPLPLLRALSTSAFRASPAAQGDSLRAKAREMRFNAVGLSCADVASSWTEEQVRVPDLVNELRGAVLLPTEEAHAHSISFHWHTHQRGGNNSAVIGS